MSGNATGKPAVRVVIGAFAFVAAMACNPDFEPIADGDRHFSVFGFLDVSADTQWVRVMPIRPSIFTSPEPIDATVTLEKVGGGQPVVLRDSIFRFAAQDVGGPSDVFVQNFWTTEPIEPNATYRFTATWPNGASSSGLVPMPDEIREVTVGINTQFAGSGYLRIEVETLAIVQVDCYHQPLPENRSGSLTIPLAKPQTAPGIPTPPCPPERLGILVVASGAPWPAGLGFTAWGAGVLERPSNVDHSVGFLGGVLTRIVPWETCTLTIPARRDLYCELTYSANSVVLQGTVRDTLCERPLGEARVQLTEILDEPAEPRRVRTVFTGVDGSYEVGALEAGVRYALDASHPARRFPDNPASPLLFLPHADTLVFEPGERATVDVELHRNFAC